MIVLFAEEKFPTLDSCPVRLPSLRRALSSVGPVTTWGTEGLRSLSADKVRLLVLPYGSAFPKESWVPLLRYLEEGGNLLTLGGRPFERPARREGDVWRVEGPQTAYHQSLGVEQWNAVPKGRCERTRANPEEPWLTGVELPPMESHSPMVRLTDMNEEDRDGSTGPMDRSLVPLLWGEDKRGRPVGCPASMVECRQGRFAGGRWVFAASRFDGWGPREDATAARLAACASLGALEAEIRPALACYSPGDQVDLSVWVRGHRRWKRKVRMEWALSLEGEKVRDGAYETTLGEASQHASLTAPIAVEPGLYFLETRVSVDGRLARVSPQGFWGWDESLVKSAPRLGVEGSRLTLDGKDLPVVGTTYMAGDVSRKFLTHPNPAVWDRDMARMEGDGVNLLRTGLWAMHRQVMLDPGRARIDALRAFDAFTLCAIRHRLPVIFNFFSFIPDAWPSAHPYLDPRALSAQREFMLAFTRRYARIPSLAWDFINEPSINNPKRLWTVRPMPGNLETDAFRDFLKKEHASLDALRESWNVTPAEVPSWEAVALPEELDFNEAITPSAGVIRSGRAFDFQKYAQGVFAGWVAGHAAVLRECTAQLLSVGQDLGGACGKRPCNHRFHAPLDMACTHAWWENEDLLFSVKAPAVKGKPLLTQETGVMFTDNLSRAKRRDEAEAGRVFERKLAASFMGGAGFLQWCWNVNPYMNERNEVEIGAWRPDGTARPEAEVLAAFGGFFRKAGEFLQGEPDEAPLAVVQSHSGNWSHRSHADFSQRAAHRALAALSLPYHTLGEWEFDRLTGEKAVLFPSVHRVDPRALAGWVRAAQGRIWVVSGPVAQDGYGRPHEGLSAFGVRERRGEVAGVETVSLKGKNLTALYTQGRPNTVDKDHGLPARIHSFRKGRARLLYQPVPVEACDDRATVVEYYRSLLNLPGVKPLCRVQGAGPMEVTVIPRHYAKTTLVIAYNEGVRDVRARVRDGKFGFTAALSLPAGRVFMGVFDSRGRALATYPPPTF